MIIRKCSTKGAFEALPENNRQLDLNKLRNLAKLKNQIKIIADTPFVIIIQDKFEVSCFKNGKLLIKNCNKKEDAEKQAKKLYKLLEK